MNCKNCNGEVTQNYCPNCGQPSKLKRIDGHYIVHEIEHVLHFERGILYTIRELMTTPGDNVRNYITESRTRLVKPIIFIIVTSLIYSIVNHFFHIEDGYIKIDDGLKATSAGVVFEWIQSHYGYANIILGIFIAFWTKLFFKKYGYNLFEILILLCFTIGMGMLILALFSIFKGLTNIDLMPFAGATNIVYCSWAIGQFFDKKKPLSYLKALASYILGMITSLVFAFAIGMLIHIVSGH